MFDNLIESKAKKQRRAGGVIFSAVLHVAVITAAVYGTLQAKDAIEKPKSEKVEFVEMKKKDEPPPPKEQPKPRSGWSSNGPITRWDICWKRKHCGGRFGVLPPISSME